MASGQTPIVSRMLICKVKARYLGSCPTPQRVWSATLLLRSIFAVRAFIITRCLLKSCEAFHPAPFCLTGSSPYGGNDRSLLAVGIFSLTYATRAPVAVGEVAFARRIFSSDYESDDLRGLTRCPAGFAVCAFRDLILPSFSAFITEKKLRNEKFPKFTRVLLRIVLLAVERRSTRLSKFLQCVRDPPQGYSVL